MHRHQHAPRNMPAHGRKPGETRGKQHAAEQPDREYADVPPPATRKQDLPSEPEERHEDRYVVNDEPRTRAHDGNPHTGDESSTGERQYRNNGTDSRPLRHSDFLESDEDDDDDDELSLFVSDFFDSDFDSVFDSDFESFFEPSPLRLRL